MENLGKADTFLETYNFLKLNQEEIEKWRCQLLQMTLNQYSKKLPTNKSTGADGFTGEFYLTINTYFFQTIPKNRRGKRTSKFIP